jgi:S1-C subfamily serine protease
MLRIARSLVMVVAFPAGFAIASAPWADDDLTFRPTVLVRQGSAAGSGTVIASLPGQTLVLTAAHVVSEGDAAVVEAHRYNLGLERARKPEGWPVRLAARVVGNDPAGDVAVLRIVGKEAMPHVARLGRPGVIARGAAVTSLGIDGAERLGSWNARVVDVRL